MAADLDCDDTRDTVYPGALEVCNNLDDDCSGIIDDNASNAFAWYYDGDNDDFGDPNIVLYQCTQPFDYIPTAGDCDDTIDTTNPNGIEMCNGVDDNCDGSVDNNATDAIRILRGHRHRWIRRPHQYHHGLLSSSRLCVRRCRL